MHVSCSKTSCLFHDTRTRVLDQGFLSFLYITLRYTLVVKPYIFNNIYSLTVPINSSLLGFVGWAFHTFRSARRPGASRSRAAAWCLWFASSIRHVGGALAEEKQEQPVGRRRRSARRPSSHAGASHAPSLHHRPTPGHGHSDSVRGWRLGVERDERRAPAAASARGESRADHDDGARAAAPAAARVDRRVDRRGRGFIDGR